MADEHDRSMMENLYWWGIPTMFRCKNEVLNNNNTKLSLSLVPPMQRGMM